MYYILRFAYLVELYRTASPPECCINIPKQEFSKDSTWTITKRYSKGKLTLETQVSLLADVTQPTQQRTTSVIIQLTVKSWNPNCEYNAEARVILYDEKAGRILKKSEEKRKIEKRKDYVKFTVDIGAHREIEESKSKKLQLQVKVQVDESRTYRNYWENVILLVS